MLVLKGYARDGLTDEEIAKKIGISSATFYNWCNRFVEIFDTIKKGREPVNVQVEDTFFEKKLQGYTVEEKTTEKTISRDKDGNIVGSTEHIKKTERYIPPDTTAMLFYMKCRMSEKYNDRLNVKVDNLSELPKLYDALKENDDDVRETVSEAKKDI